MSRISERIRNILKYADSSKVTDKKKCVTELLDLYMNSDILKEICQNTKRKTQDVNWSCIMHTVHKLVLSEAERPGKETSIKQNERQAIFGLVVNTVRHSNEKSAELLKSSEIISMILQILNSKLYVYYQDTYLGILVKYILPKSSNHKDITTEQWRELLTICMKLYKREHLKKNIVLSALQMIVEYSFFHVNLLEDVKNLLLFLENVFEDAKRNDEQLAESFYKLTNSVCKQITFESRIALSKFSESILTDMLRLNGSEEKYKLLLVFLQIHHPDDISRCDAYAYDWDKWKSLLRNMCLLIQENCKLDVQWLSFVQFAGEVVKQMIHNADSFGCSLDVTHDNSRYSSSKRRRIINKMENVVELITESSPEEVWSWVKIVTETLKRYPQCLRTQDLAPLLQYLTELVQSSSRTSESIESVTNNFYNLAVVLMENEMSIGEVQDATIHWSKIWDMLLRSLGTNQNGESGHALARCFIKHNRIPNANAILRLYLTKTIRWSLDSVYTLRQLCKRISLPEDASTSVLDPSPSSTPICDRTRLLEWLLNAPWQNLMTRLPVNDICALSVDIILSSRCRQNVKMESVLDSRDLNFTQNHEKRHRVTSASRNIYRSDLQLCYSSLAFKMELLACPKEKCVEIDPRVASNGSVSYVQETFSFLREQLHNILQEETANNEVLVVLKLALLARLLSTLKQLGALTEDIVGNMLIDMLQKYLTMSFQVLAQINKCKYTYLVSVIRALTILYTGTYDADIARIIASATTENMVRNIFNLLNVEDTYDRPSADNRHSYDYYEERTSRHNVHQEGRRRSVTYSESSSGCENSIHLLVVEALTSFCALNIGEDKCTLQTKTMKNLLTMQQNFTSYTDVRMSLTIFESLAGCDQEEIQREHADTPLEFLLAICQTNPKDEEILHRLLSLLPFFFEYATRYRYSPKRIIETLSAFYKHIHKCNCGILMHIDYMKCICSVVRIDSSFSWSTDSEEVTVMLNSVLSYIGHSLFLLRAQSVRCLQELLSFEKVAYEWKEQMFVTVRKTMFELLSTNQQLSFHSQSTTSLEMCLQEDEKETRTTTALVALASVACSNEVLQGRALHAMLQLTVEKKTNVQKVKKVLSTAMQQTMCPSLVEDNLNYLLTAWIDSKYSLQSFPWILMECKSVNEFFTNYINRIIPLLLRTSGLEEAVTFCNNIDVSFSVVFKDVFPSCLVWLISRVCDQSASSIDNVAFQTLKKLQKNMDEFVSTCNFARLLNDHLTDVLVELVQRLYDETHFECIFSHSMIVFPKGDPPHFSAAVVNQCFDFLDKNFIKISMKKPLVRVLAERQPAVLQKVLLHLINAVYLARSSESKLMRLHQYAYFCGRIIQDVKEPFFKHTAAFFIRDVCYSLLHLAGSDNDEALSAACCKFLDLFLRQTLPNRSAEVQDILRFVTSNLIGLAQNASSAEVALSLLTFLIVEQRDALCEAIAKLGAFPNLKIFREVRESHKVVRYANEAGSISLEEELEHFLVATNNENAECALEDLANLTEQLSTRQTELKKLQKLERQYPEDSISILHQVIFKLVKLTESPNVCISMEATRCLGELGPTNSTIALRPSGSSVRETEHMIEALTYRSVAMLSNFLVEKAMELRKVSADALYAVLSTTCGRKLIDPKYKKDLSNIFHECVPLKIDYIWPFTHSRIVTDKSFSVNIVKFRNIMNPMNALWTINNNENYVEWIVKVTCGIAECFEDSYLESFLSVCRLSIEFCELLLPRIISLAMQQCESSVGITCDCVNQFFRYHFAMNHDVEAAALVSAAWHGNCDRKIVRCMLDMVNYVRTQLPDDLTLKLDYIYLARAAHSCAAYYTALLFAQLACESFSMEYPDFSSDPKIDYIYERQPQLGRVLQNIMQDTYLNISDPDAICGAGSSYLLDHSSRIQYYARTNSWDKVILAQDIEMSHNNLLTGREMANALHHSGLQFLQWLFLNNSKHVLDDKFSYECAWRLSNWDLIVSDTITNKNDSSQLRQELPENVFHRHHYHALKCFHENDQRGMEMALESARRSVIRCLKVVSLESSRTVNEKLSQLRLLREIEQLSMADSQEYPALLQRWNDHGILTGQFEYVEPILQQRIVLFQIKETLKTDMSMQKAFFATCLNLATIAKGQGNFPVATRALAILAKHHNLFDEDLQNQLLYQESLLEWMKCDQIIARRLLRRRLFRLIEKKDLNFSLKAKVLHVYGDWMAETQSTNPQVIQKYYLESIESSKAIDEQTPDVIKNLHNTQVALARFADAQYEQIDNYMKSSVYESLKEYARPTGEVVTEMMKNADIKRAVIFTQKQLTNDAAELENIAQERCKYLLQALKYYLKTLRDSEEHNLLIYRLIALWSDNMFDKQVDELLNQLQAIPSFKFITLMPQLAAHMSNNLDKGFSKKIFDLLKRCAMEHPYHTLPVVLALKNLHHDDEYESGTIRKEEEQRVLGAKKLLQQLANSKVRLIVHEMETLSKALVSLAYWQPKRKVYTTSSCQIPRDQPISKIKNLTNILLPTLSLSLRPSGNYGNVVGVRSYEETCEFVGGINAPKKVVCLGTDGIKRRQLVKGKDDLRQDAVMQQVFTVVNTLLKTCKETKRRNLRIRTYKVIPLTQRSGVLEWCDNTVPIVATLTGSTNAPGLHKKYYPRDMTLEEARNKMKNNAQESNEVKLKVFLECCKRLRPAFQHFFQEKYVSPETWVERTLTYTRSVATTSIAGYILGLGDRHLSNILIDKRTAEVVHIDFGIAFEQGKVIPIPETVPFRLTRDIEVAMGVSGIEGTMRRSCEVTMTMLRDQRQIIITLLQVLLYDPLFTWVVPEKIYKMQSEVVGGFSKSEQVPVETNKIAKRALLRIEQKLQGTEDGLVCNVAGQVERLLQQARDPANLSRLYCGWQPYL